MKISLDEVNRFNQKYKNKMLGGYQQNPITIQEKLRWLNINDIPWDYKREQPLKTTCADKILVKDYANDVLGIEIGVPIIKVYNSLDDIIWDELPNKFIIKVNHNSGGTIICKDKTNFNKFDAIIKLDYWMKDDFTFRNGFESHYHWIDRKIIVEEFLCDDKQQDSLFDYKFWCFNGEPKLYTMNTNYGHGDIMYYDMNDQPMNLYGYVNPPIFIKPNKFDTMINYAKELSKPFKFVRVDFYEVNNKIYLGEMTFVPGAAAFSYKNNEDNIKIGNLLKL